MTSVLLRCWKQRVSYLAGSSRDARPGDARLNALCLQWVCETVGVIAAVAAVAAVAEQPLRSGHVVEQRCSAGVVADPGSLS